ncbi:MAG: 3-deoxy-manno-octulosonate cytidylyltransferase [Prevotella sp.]|nr:3-deoxy-manno-octulosonate cytidylyltransferase [Prevotella sp.]
MKFIAIIPARYASTRFPGKPLALLGGKTVIERVVEQVSQVIGDVRVATDDVRIARAVEGFGGSVVMTRSDHKSGTDRIREAMDIVCGLRTANAGQAVTPLPRSEWPDVVVNVQGDEPFIQPSQIATVMQCFDDEATEIATLGKPFTSMDAVRNPNSPKIVTDLRGNALYFSRSVIPYVRGKAEEEWASCHTFLKHIGLYAYRREVLCRVTELPQSPLEVAESLEQLRWLQNGYRIKVGLTDVETVGIDTPEDLERAEQILNNHYDKKH